MNKNVYKWLAVTLLLSVSVFCYLYLTKISKDDVAPTAVAETPSDKPANAPDVGEDEPAPPPISYNELPRAAHNYENFIVQNAGGSQDETLKSVHIVADKRYAFFDTASNGGDVRADKGAVAVAVFDEELTLLRVVVLQGQENEAFAGVKLTADGFIVATAATTYSTLYTLDFNLVTVNKLTLEPSTGLRLYADGTNVHLLFEKSDRLQIKVLNKNLEVTKTATAFLENPKVFEVFQSGATLNIFANTSDGYALLKYTADGGFASVNTVHDTTLLAVQPFDGGYVGIRKTSNVSTVFLSDANFSLKDESAPFDADYALLFSDGENINVYKAFDGAAESIVFCKHLDKILIKPAPFFEAVLYRDYSNDTVIGFAESVLSVASYDGLAFEVLAEYSGKNSFACVLYDGTVCFTSPFKNGVYADNFGNNDIFLIKNLGA